MRVLHICNLPPSPDHPERSSLSGHPGRWALNLAIAQQKHTAIHPECLVLLPRAKRAFSTVWEGIPIYYMPAPARGRTLAGYRLELPKAVAYVRSRKPDLVHSHGTECSNLHIALKSSRPHVLTAQGMYFLIHDIMPYPRLSRERLAMRWEAAALKRCRYAIAKSAYVRNAICNKYPHIECAFIPNTYDESLFEKLPQREPKPVITFVGSIIPRKGFDLVVDAMRLVINAHPDVRLHVFGNTEADDAYQRKWMAECMSIMGPSVTFRGVRPALDVVNSLARSAALVAPSREEMFGNQVIEALLCGAHAIVTEKTAMAENVERFGNGTIIKQENPDDLARAILAILSAPASADHQSAQERIKSYMGPAVVAGQHHAYYRQILARW
jgi:glycosyltransferase involved in cell wall biosynthesis